MQLTCLGFAAGSADTEGAALITGGEGPGILEVKCPFNRGRPQTAKPYPVAPYYYMPQVRLISIGH